MASIEQRGDSYRVVWRRAGRKESVTALNEDEAQRCADYAKSLRHGVDAAEVYRAVLGVERPSETMRLTEWIQQWECRATGVQPDTVATYARLARRAAEQWSDPYLDQITQAQVRQRIAEVDASRSGGTALKCLTALARVLGDAVGEGLIPTSPVAGVRRPKYQPDSDVEVLTADQEQSVLAELDGTDRLLVRTGLATGMRWGELCALQPTDITGRETPKVHVRRAAKVDGTLGAPKSKRSRRAIAIPDELAKDLRELVGEWLFPAPSGVRWAYRNFRRRRWDAAVTAAGREGVGLHIMRHTHASRLLGKGVPLHVVSRRLGHSTITLTADTYGHLLSDSDEQVLAALG